MFGQPAILRLSSQPRRHGAHAARRAPGRGGARRVHSRGLRAAHGRRTRRGRRASSPAPKGTELRIESTLQGLAIGLPEPFAKRADESRALAVTIRRLGTAGGGDGGGAARAACTRASAASGTRRARAGMRRSSSARRWPTEPVREGLWLYGDARAVRPRRLARGARGARRRRPRPRERRPRWSCAASTCASSTLRYTGRDIAQLAARLQREGGRMARHAREPGHRRRGDLRPAGPRAHRRRACSASRSSRPPRGAAGPEPAPPAEQDDASRARHRGRALRVPRPLAGPARARRAAGRRATGASTAWTSPTTHARFASSGRVAPDRDGAPHAARPQARHHEPARAPRAVRLRRVREPRRGEARGHARLARLPLRVHPGDALGALQGGGRPGPVRARSSRARASSWGSCRCSRSRGA